MLLEAVLPQLEMRCSRKEPNPYEGLAWVQEGEGATLLKRVENEGMDFAAHNVSMSFAMRRHRQVWARYKYFVFLNSSVKGPFVPKYYPFHWSQPYLSLMHGRVKAVSSSLVCLPAVDAGTATLIRSPHHKPPSFGTLLS
jgi:hypothetical protein